MNLKVARFCVDCEEIFVGRGVCPACGNSHSVPLSLWLNRRDQGEGKARAKEEKSNIPFSTGSGMKHRIQRKKESQRNAFIVVRCLSLAKMHRFRVGVKRANGSRSMIT